MSGGEGSWGRFPFLAMFIYPLQSPLQLLPAAGKLRVLSEW